MAMKTVICLSFTVLNNFLRHVSGPLLGGGGKRGRRPPKQNSSPPQTAQHTHPNFRYPCSSFKMVAFFLWKPTETSEKSRPHWRDDFFWDINRELGEN